MLYLDSSALVKLVQREAETQPLRRFLRQNPDERRVTCALARVEVVRAVAHGGPEAIAGARRQLARVDEIQLDRLVLDDAAVLLPTSVLRSLDAIHLAAARSLGPDLRAVVTYDQRLGSAARSIGLNVEAPA